MIHYYVIDGPVGGFLLRTVDGQPAHVKMLRSGVWRRPISPSMRFYSEEFDSCERLTDLVALLYNVDLGDAP